MNKLDRRLKVTDYEVDYALWCAEQGALLREGRLDALDRENLAEEIESLGRSDRREIESRLRVLLTHLLKWRFQPEQRKGGWRVTIRDQRTEISKTIKESPSLGRYPAVVLSEEYGFARANAADETGLPVETLPTECPFAIEEILDVDWLPEAAEEK
jgi:hypothetical protein